MKTLTIRAYAKINWSLNVTGRREDGYHNLDTLMANVSLYDTLVMTQDEDVEAGKILFDVEGGGTDIPTDESNIVVKAVRAVEQAAGKQLGLRIRLFKRIPSRAGFGGGSADAGAALIGASKLLSVDESLLPELAVKLGADVPFFLQGGTQRAQGIGDVLTPCKSATFHLVLATAPGGVSTKELFGAFRCNMYRVRSDNRILIRALENGNLPLMQINCINQLTDAAVRFVPEIEAYLHVLEDCRGCVCAGMSGSGSGVFGLFLNESLAERGCAAAKEAGLLNVVAVHTVDNGWEIEQET